MSIKYRSSSLRPGEKSHWYCDLCGEEVESNKVRHICKVFSRLPVGTPTTIIASQNGNDIAWFPAFELERIPMVVCCPICHSSHRKLSGTKKRKTMGPAQRFMCLDCGYKWIIA